MNDDLPYVIGFNVFSGIGPVRFKLLRDYFGGAKNAWDASVRDLSSTGLTEKLVQSFDRFRREFDVRAYQSKLSNLHVYALSIDDARYPTLLKEIPDAPFLLYVLGKRTDEQINLTRTVAVVGTRQITPYGKEVTERLVTELVNSSCTIVSGLAYGVDAAAHWAAIDAGGKTIAVLGCGIDIIAPASNAKLYRAICDGNGAIVSEVPLGVRPVKGLFPARNRIISGLSLGVIVTEGAKDSGTLITARYAAEQGREVFAVPGPITSRFSHGPSLLLKEGAKLVESAQDVLTELGLTPVGRAVDRDGKNAQRGTTKEEQQLLAQLGSGTMHIDEIVRGSHLTMSAVAATLTILEMKGCVKDYGDKVYGLT